LLATAATFAMASPALAQQAPASTTAPVIHGAWSDTTKSPDERAAAALAAMTPDEKLSLLSTPIAMFLPPSVTDIPKSGGYIRAIPRLGLGNVSESDASLGVANIADMRKGDVATALPSSLALGASFDPDLAFAGGKMIGSEARAKGFGIMLAGGANLIRDPRGGRTFEYISEDPLLTGLLAGKAVAGIQSNHIVSTTKHYAVNDTETGRNVYNVTIPEAALRESDLLAFQILHETGKPGSVMCSYNRVNEVHACENSFLLNEVLRRDWGFTGWVMSDWGAVHSVGALDAGLDQQSGFQVDPSHYFGKDLQAALAAGKVSQASVDRAATRILRTLFAAGVYDNPPRMGAAIDYAANGKVAQAQAEAGIVLLRNQGGLLPLAQSAKRIVVIGGHADVGALIGGGSAQVAPVGGVKLALSSGGEGIAALIKQVYGGTAPLTGIREEFPQAKVDYIGGTDAVAAASFAAGADVVVLFADKWASEGKDVPDLSLGNGQDALIAAVAKANPRTVVVLETGNPVLMPWQANVGAILQAWFPGQEGGRAIARILSGSVNPSGRLPITFPASTAQLPNPTLPGSDVPAPAKGDSNFGRMADKVPFTYSFPEGSDAGYRWYDKTKAKPLYPFGHGLSYTSFAYSGLRADGGETITAKFTVHNTGKLAGTDIPQVYVTAPGKAKRLVGWGRPTLAAGASQPVTVTADPRLLADYDPQSRSWIIRPGAYKVEVSRSASEPVLTAVVRMKELRAPDQPK
jgi:beta-glucosidase